MRKSVLLYKIFTKFAAGQEKREKKIEKIPITTMYNIYMLFGPLPPHTSMIFFSSLLFQKYCRLWFFEQEIVKSLKTSKLKRRATLY